MKKGDSRRRKYLIIFLFIVVIVTIIGLFKYNFWYRSHPIDRETTSINPYLGFTMNPDINKRINPMGFDGPLITKDKNIYSVGVFGGSVAYLYTYAEKDALVNELKRIPALRDKNIQLYNFSLPGYKQPQQLMTLAYLLSLGYKLDLIINIDGFNEAVLPYVANYKNGVTSSYPWNWYLYSRSSLNSETLTLVIQIEKLRNLQSFVISLPWKLGAIPNTLLLKAISYKQLELTDKLHEIDRSYQTKGAEPYYGLTDAQIRDGIIQTWKNSSILMDKLAKSNNIQYFEFLPPNQYLLNSKPFSNAEKTKFINWRHPYANAARQLYPQIIAKTQELNDEGVALYDLTNIFSQVEETIYFDDCCHYVRKGYSLLTTSIINSIKEKIR